MFEIVDLVGVDARLRREIELGKGAQHGKPCLLEIAHRTLPTLAIAFVATELDEKITQAEFVLGGIRQQIRQLEANVAQAQLAQPVVQFLLGHKLVQISAYYVPPSRRLRRQRMPPATVPSWHPAGSC